MTEEQKRQLEEDIKRMSDEEVYDFLLEEKSSDKEQYEKNNTLAIVRELRPDIFKRSLNEKELLDDTYYEAVWKALEKDHKKTSEKQSGEKFK